MTEAGEFRGALARRNFVGSVAAAAALTADETQRFMAAFRAVVS